MAQIQPLLRIELNLKQPVVEICNVISAVTAYHPEQQEEVILRGIQKAIDKRLSELKELEQ